MTNSFQLSNGFFFKAKQQKRHKERDKRRQEFTTLRFADVREAEPTSRNSNCRSSFIDRQSALKNVKMLTGEEREK